MLPCTRHPPVINHLERLVSQPLRPPHALGQYFVRSEKSVGVVRLVTLIIGSTVAHTPTLDLRDPSTPATRINYALLNCAGPRPQAISLPGPHTMFTVEASSISRESV